jgi:hypothetical protein
MPWMVNKIFVFLFSELPSSLISLSLAFNRKLEDLECSHLPKGLKKLNLFKCTIGDIGIDCLPISLENLDISWTKVTDNVLKILPKFQRMTKLNISNTTISQIGSLLFGNSRSSLKILIGCRSY